MSESKNVGMSSCCLSGHIASGTPSGVEEQIGGLQTYVATPKDGSKKKSIVFLVDIFGYKLNNVRLLADTYAANGFTAYIPDVHEGDSLPESFLQTVEPQLPDREKMSIVDKATSTASVGTTLGPWLLKHREAVAKPLIDNFISTIRKTPGVDKLGVIGFCWGGRYAILAAGTKGPQGVDAAYACHPSLVAIPGDFDPIQAPISFALGDKDSLLGEKEIGQIQDVMGKKTEVPHEIRIYEDQVHGFALRGDWKSDKDKKSMDEATKQGVEWFNKYLS